jgi:hypothetical protein
MNIWIKISLILFVITIISAVVIYFLNKLRIKLKISNQGLARELAEIRERFKDIIDLEEAKVTARTRLLQVQNEEAAIRGAVEQLTDQEINLRKQIAIYESDIEVIDCGHYKPFYNYDISQKYKDALDEAREQQKQMLKDETAAVCSQTWTVNGKVSDGKKMSKQYIKLMLRAFNGESDAIVANVKWNNVAKMIDRLEAAYQAINKLGETHSIKIQRIYFQLKLNELKLTYEYQEKLNIEKEEQKRIREQMREDERVQREMEKVQKEAEEEEKRYEQALEKAKVELQNAHGELAEKMQSKIALLEQQLQEAMRNKERAISRAQLTKSGHVYVISNIGSFGENRYKIGMTRRLEPQERVRELSDASVPFDFDIHAMIYSENAPALENKLHDIFSSKRLNLVNERKEFFYVSIEEIEEVVKGFDAKLEIIKVPEARDYRQTVAIWNSWSQQGLEQQSNTEEQTTVANETISMAS